VSKPRGKFLLCYFLLFYFSILIFGNLFGQSASTIDSLEKLIITQENDTNKIQNLVTVAKGYFERDMEKAAELAENIKSLSQQLKYVPGLADYHYIRSSIYLRQFNFDSSHYHIEKALGIIESLGSNQRLANYYRLKAIIFRRQGFNVTATAFYKKSLDLYEKNHDKDGIAKSYNSLGIIYDDAMKYDSALKYYFKSLALAEKSDYLTNLLPPLINIGKIFYYLSDYENALKYFNKCLDLSNKEQNISFIGQSYNNLGMVYQKLGQFQKALEYYGMAYDQFYSHSDYTDMGDATMNIGTVHKEMGDQATALKKYQESLEINKSIQNVTGIINNELNIALLYEAQGNYKKTLQIYDSCLAIAIETNYVEKIPIIYFNISKTYELAGNWEKAFQYQSLYYSMEDSIFSVEKNRVMRDLELNYEKEKNEAEILKLKNENLQKDLEIKNSSYRRNIFIFLTIFILVTGLLLFVLFYNRTRKNKIILEQKLRQAEDEKRLLAAQSIVEGQEQERKRIAIDLHDGLGILLSSAKLQFSNIIDKVPEYKEILHKANKLMEQAATDVRKISHNMMPGTLTKLGLVDAIEGMFEQFEDNGQISGNVNIIGTPVRLPENSEIMLYRILQELLNNSLKHAEARNIALNLNFKDNLLIQYSDDGKGFNVEDKLMLNTFGLKSIQSRVGFLKGWVTFESNPGKGFTTFIQVPITKLE
jgi:two-component system, NarL family, sensor kinase